MTQIAISTLIPQWFDTDGKPLSQGRIYIGVPFENPITNPVTVYWDAAGTQPAAQPLKTKNGFIVHNGRAAPVFAPTDFSITVLDRRGQLVYSYPSAALASPSSQIAAGLAELRADLLNFTDADKGAGMVGYGASVIYPPNTIGAALQALLSGVGYKRLKADYGLVMDGIADDTAKLRTVIAMAPEGISILFDGYCRITDTVVWDRNVQPMCFSRDQGLIVDVGNTKDGLVFYSASATGIHGMNGMTGSLNVYGGANCCVHGVTFNRVDRSRITLNVHLGATAAGTRVRGCLLNRWDIESSANYKPPASCPVTVGFQANHIFVENYGVPQATPPNWLSVAVSGPASPGVVTLVGHGFTANTPLVFGGTGQPPVPFIQGKPYFVNTVDADHFQLTDTRGGASIITTGAGSSCQLSLCFPIASNNNDFYANMEGGGQGYVQVAMPGEGNNTLHGEAEGLSGAPFFFDSHLGGQVTQFAMEQNTVGCTVKDSNGVVIGPKVQFLEGGVGAVSLLTVTNCVATQFLGWYGDLLVDANSKATRIYSIDGPRSTSHTILDTSAIQLAPSYFSDNSTGLGGGAGFPSMECIFVNPGFDIYDTTATNVGPPRGCNMEGSYTSGDIILELSDLWDHSTMRTAAKCTSRGTSITNGMKITPALQPWPSDEWLAVCVGVKPVSASIKVFVYLDDGVQFKLIGATRSGGAYETIRGSVKPAKGNNYTLRFAVMNAAGTAYVSGFNYFVGGIAIVKGALPPQSVETSSGREGFVSGSVAQNPWKKDALANTGAALYWAMNTAAPTDWKQVFP